MSMAVIHEFSQDVTIDAQVRLIPDGGITVCIESSSLENDAVPQSDRKHGGHFAIRPIIERHVY